MDCREEPPVIRSVLRWIAMVTVVWGSACSPPPAVDSLGLVPPDARVVAVIDWPAVNRSDYLRRVLATDRFRDQLTKAGIDPAGVKKIVAFQTESGPDDSAAILTGTFRHRSGASAQPGSAGTVQVQARPDRVVVGAKHAVDETVALGKSLRPTTLRENAEARRLLSLLPRGAPFQAVLIVQGLARDTASFAYDTSLSVLSFTRLAPIAGILGRIGVPFGIACAISPTAGGASATMIARMRDEEAASFVAGGLNFMRSAALSMAPLDPRIGGDADVIRGLKLNRSKDVVRIEFPMPDR